MAAKEQAAGNIFKLGSVSFQERDGFRGAGFKSVFQRRVLVVINRIVYPRAGSNYSLA